MRLDKKMFMTILTFKTNIRFNKDVAKVTACLQQYPGIVRWNVDLEDVDKVLRIETCSATPDEIVAVIRQCGYECDELPD